MTGAISIATKKANKIISFRQGKAPETFRGFFISTGDDIWKLRSIQPPVSQGT